jgi:hypothetical protein
MRSQLGRLMLWALVLCGLVALMSTPVFNPGHFRGSWFGLTIMGLWAWALFVWVIGVLRKHKSRPPARIFLFASVALALMFGACPWLPVPHSIRLGFAVISAVMIHEAGHGDDQPMAFRGRLSRTVLGSAGLLGLAVALRSYL